MYKKLTGDFGGSCIQQLLSPALLWMNLLAAPLVLRVTLVMSSQGCESAVGRFIELETQLL